jgi:hypothetical protein
MQGNKIIVLGRVKLWSNFFHLPKSNFGPLGGNINPLKKYIWTFLYAFPFMYHMYISKNTWPYFTVLIISSNKDYSVSCFLFPS